MQMSITSTQYVKVPVSVALLGQSYDPSADVMQMAFIALPSTGISAVPQTTDWVSAQWEDATSSIICLVGPSGLQLSAGVYDVWVRIHDNPEVPAIKAGNLTIS